MSEGLALEGLKVLSLAEQYPGPYATLVLADLGASVTLIERPPGGDPSRRSAGFFESLARGKRSVALDLKSAGGREALLALARTADVLLEGFRPGVLAKLGLGYNDLAAVNPRLVYVSLSGFGQDGPYRDLPGHDLSFQALSGVLHRHIGQAKPEAPWLSLSNLSGGLFAVIGALSALRAREQTGRGTHVDIALLDSLISLMTVHLVPQLNGTGPAVVPPEPGYGLFTTADGRLLSLSIYGEDHFWAKLCRVTGMRGARLAFADRVAQRDALTARLRRIVVKRPYAEWAPLLTDAGIPFSPVLELAEVPEDPQVRARGMIVEVGAAGSTPRRRYVRQPIRLAGNGGGPRSHPPGVGEHTRAALVEAGFSPARVAELLGSGAAWEPPR